MIMNKEITPNEIANAIGEVLDERDDLKTQIEEQNKALKSWYEKYHKLKREKEIKDKEIERLNNIINELEKTLEYEKNDYNGNIDIETHNIDSEFLRGNSWEADYILNKLKELKERGKK